MEEFEGEFDSPRKGEVEGTWNSPRGRGVKVENVINNRGKGDKNDRD